MHGSFYLFWHNLCCKGLVKLLLKGNKNAKNIKKLTQEDISQALRHLEKTFLEGKPSSSNLQMVDINLIVLKLKSLRKHSKKQLQKLINAILKVGYVNPVLLDKKHNIIAGELRLLAAKELGFT